MNAQESIGARTKMLCYSDPERRSVILLHAVCLPCGIGASALALGWLFREPLRFGLPLILLASWVCLRNLILLWRESWLRTAFLVDERCILKVWPSGKQQAADWESLVRVSDTDILPTFRPLRTLRRFFTGLEPVRLVFANGAVITISKLVGRSPQVVAFWRVYGAIGQHGCPNNLLLQAIKREIEKSYRILAKIKKTERRRWYIISQIFPVGLFVIENVFYHLFNVSSWSHYVAFMLVSLVLSPVLLIVMYVCFRFGFPWEPRIGGN